MLPNSKRFTLTTKPWVWFFACRIFIFGLLKSNFEVRQDTSEFKYLIDTYYWFRPDWSWNISCCIFRSMIIEQVVEPRSPRPQNLKYRTDPWGRVMKSIIWMVGEKYNRWLFSGADCFKNLGFENRSSLSLVLWMQVSKWLSNIAFIWNQFDCKLWLQSGSWKRSFRSFCTQPSEMTILFDWHWNLSRRSQAPVWKGRRFLW